MKIGELSERTGVPTRLLRYYEEQALISPSRGINGYRSYSDADISRVESIRGLISSGMTTRLIRVVLDMETSAGCASPSCSLEFADMLAQELGKLEEKIACLTRSRNTVKGFLATATVDGSEHLQAVSN
jgi:DNA-binding transcriptional MerR regulator